MTFYMYTIESKRLNLQEGLGDWKTRPLEYKGDVPNGQQQQQQSAGTLRPAKTFSQRCKAKEEPISEETKPYPPTSAEDNQGSNSQQLNPDSNRLGNNISLCPRQDTEGSSSKPRKQSFSSFNKRKG